MHPAEDSPLVALARIILEQHRRSSAPNVASSPIREESPLVVHGKEGWAE
jgi:hypothetical protein